MILSFAASAIAEDLNVPVLVPVTGFLSLEGTSQRDGAVMALDEAAASGLDVSYAVDDTGTDPSTAVNALERALSDEPVSAVAASMFGPQMLAMIPVADRVGVPLVTVSGTAKITELGSPWVFRFFPGDAVTKVAHVRYAVEELGVEKPALIYQTTAYGQSGAEHIKAELKARGIKPVLEEGLDVAVQDMVPVLTKVRGAGADSILLHLHSKPTALFVRAAVGLGNELPIVAGSAMHQPATAALLDPAELEGICAESASTPVSGGTAAMDDWLARYRDKFGSDPDAFALGQYDGLKMVEAAWHDGARTPEAIRDWLSSHRYDGLAMTYKSDGKGNMAHSAVILCYDGESRVPEVVERYENITGALD